MMAEYNPFSLKNKTILVTGASSGIGRSVAVECSRMGATVLLTARNEQKLLKTLSLMSDGGHRYYLKDLSCSEEVELLAKEVGKIDGLINNAGFTTTLPVQFITGEKLQAILDVNTVAPIMLLSKLVKNKSLSKGASVVFITSISGVYGGVLGNSMYSASKGAIDGFVKNAALDLSVKGIRVNAISPGMIETEILSSGTISEKQLEEDRKKYPMRRYGRPEEVAYAAVYLLSDASAWTTGTSLLIDGGRMVNI